jgi:hypothetical protein
MTIPAVTTTNPVNGATSSPTDGAIFINFNTALDPSTVSAGTVLLYITDTNDLVDSIISVSGSTVQILPKNILREETSYSCLLIGNDPAGQFQAIKSLDTNTDMASNYIFAFRTGVDQYATITELTSRDDIERIAPIRVSELPALQGLQLVTSSPKNFKTNIPNDSLISLVFSSGVTATPENYITVEQFPVLGLDDYYGSPDASGICPRMKAEVQNDLCVVTSPNFNYDVPGVTIVSVGDTVNITFDKDLLYGTEVVVTVDPTFPSVDNTATLGKEEILAFTSQFHPLFVSAQMVRMELGAAVTHISNDMMNRLIMKNSIEYWEFTGRTFDMCCPTQWARMYVQCKTVMDLLDVVTITNQINQGMTKTLGDFTVSQTALSGSGGPKRSTAEKCIAKELGRISASRCSPKVGVVGSNARNHIDYSLRLWKIGGIKSPIANSCVERQIKGIALNGSYNPEGAWVWSVDGDVVT